MLAFWRNVLYNRKMEENAKEVNAEMTAYQRHGRWKVSTVVFLVLAGAAIAAQSRLLFSLTLVLLPLFAVRCVPLRGLHWGSIVTKLLFTGVFVLAFCLMPKLASPAILVWLIGCAGMFLFHEHWLRGYRMGLYWALCCFAATIALAIPLIQRYQVYGDFFEGLSYDLLRIIMPDRARAQILASAYTAGLASLDAKRAIALENLAKLTNGNVLPWLSSDVLQQLEWSFRATIELTLHTALPDLLVKSTILFSSAMLYLWGISANMPALPNFSRWYLPTQAGRALGILLLLSAVQLFAETETVAMAASMAGCTAFWLFTIQGASAYSYALKSTHVRAREARLPEAASAKDWHRRAAVVLTLLFLPMIPFFLGVVDQIRDPRSLRKDRRHQDEDLHDF